MKIFALTFFILCSGCIFAETVNLNCAFENQGWWILGTVNTCKAWSQGEIITDNSDRHVTTINRNTNSNPSVKAVYIKNSNCFYFPHGLQKLFTDLQGIWIGSSKLREVRWEDLKEYTNLIHIDLKGNEIQFLEPNLFEFNLKLEVIELSYNKIAHIDANVFNNFVGKLRYLYLRGNICQFENADDDKSKANQIIEKVQSGSCQDISKLPTTVKLDALTKLIGDLIIKIETQNSEIKDEFKEVKDELKEVKDQNSGVKDELKALKDEQTETRKKLWLW